jgi:exodeoxyribonuclease VII small subunit
MSGSRSDKAGEASEGAGVPSPGEGGALSESAPGSFEEAVERLEGIIARIETGEVGLEESLTQYEEGMKLIRHCRAILDRAEKKVEELTLSESGGGKPADEPQAGSGGEDGPES